MESFTPRRTNLAVVDAVDFHFDFISLIAFDSLWLGSRVSWTCLGTEEASALSGEMIRGSNKIGLLYVLSGFPLCEVEGADGLFSRLVSSTPPSSRLGLFCAPTLTPWCRFT